MSSGFPASSEHKMSCTNIDGLNFGFRMYIDGLYYLYSENKGADKLRGLIPRSSAVPLLFAYAKSSFFYDAAHVFLIFPHFGTKCKISVIIVRVFFFGLPINKMNCLRTLCSRAKYYHVYIIKKTTCSKQGFWPPLKPKIESCFTTFSLDCFNR